MSDSNGPQHLDKVLEMMPGMKSHLRSKLKRRHPSVTVAYKKHPRQICDICNKLFDYAVCSSETVPQITRCSDCKTLLTEGYTAFRSLSGGWAFLKSSAFKEHMKGAIRTVSDEELEQIKKAMTARAQ